MNEPPQQIYLNFREVQPFKSCALHGPFPHNIYYSRVCFCQIAVSIIFITPTFECMHDNIIFYPPHRNENDVLKFITLHPSYCQWWEIGKKVNNSYPHNLWSYLSSKFDVNINGAAHPGYPVLSQLLHRVCNHRPSMVSSCVSGFIMIVVLRWSGGVIR